jgi:hypothetical protein
MLRIPTGRLKREWSLLAIFGRANRSHRDISNTWLKHGFLSSNPTCHLLVAFFFWAAIDAWLRIPLHHLHCFAEGGSAVEASKTEWLSKKCKLLFRASVTWLTHLLPVPP